MTIRSVIRLSNRRLKGLIAEAKTIQRRRFVVWAGVSLFLILFAIAFGLATFSSLEAEQSLAGDEGKRVVVDIQTGRMLVGTLQEASNLIEQELKPEEQLVILAEGEELTESETETAEKEEVVPEAVGPEAVVLEVEEDPAEDMAAQLEQEVLAAQQLEQAETIDTTENVTEEEPNPLDLVLLEDKAKPELELQSSKKTEVISVGNETVASSLELPQLLKGKYTHKIAVIIRHLGLKADVTQRALNMPSGVALAFSMYSPEMLRWLKEAQEKQHKVMLELPLEDEFFPYSDPGPLALLSNTNSEQNLLRLQTILQTASGVKTLIADDREVFTHKPQSIIPVLDSMRRNGVFFIFQEDKNNEFVSQQARTVGLEHRGGYWQLDATPTKETIYAQMQRVYETINQDKGDILISVDPYALSLDLIEKLVVDMAEAEYTLSAPQELAEREFNFLR